jgi:RimJ/RimL family protein N-acetyltransferase
VINGRFDQQRVINKQVRAGRRSGQLSIMGGDSTQVLLTTQRLTLRQFTADDLDNLVALDADRQVMRFLTGGAPTPREVLELRVLPSLLRAYRNGPGSRWAADSRDSGEFLGWFALTPSPDSSQLELGYRIRSSAWGHGYASEGTIALVSKAFLELGAERVFAQTMAVNAASRCVMVKAGLRYLRTFHEHWDEPIEGFEKGEVEYALTRAEWDASR